MIPEGPAPSAAPPAWSFVPPVALVAALGAGGLGYVWDQAPVAAGGVALAAAALLLERWQNRVWRRERLEDHEQHRDDVRDLAAALRQTRADLDDTSQALDVMRRRVLVLQSDAAQGPVSQELPVVASVWDAPVEEVAPAAGASGRTGRAAPAPDLHDPAGDDLALAELIPEELPGPVRAARAAAPATGQVPVAQTWQPASYAELDPDSPFDDDLYVPPARTETAAGLPVRMPMDLGPGTGQVPAAGSAAGRGEVADPTPSGWFTPAPPTGELPVVTATGPVPLGADAAAACGGEVAATPQGAARAADTTGDVREVEWFELGDAEGPAWAGMPGQRPPLPLSGAIPVTSGPESDDVDAWYRTSRRPGQPPAGR